MNRFISIMLTAVLVILSFGSLPSCAADEELVLMNTFHIGTNKTGTRIAYNGDETHSQNGATLTVCPREGNNGSGFVLKYVGEKLSFHGADDNARRENSWVDFRFSSGVNSTADSIAILECELSTNAPGRTYVTTYYGNTTACIVANANSELQSDTKHKIKIVADRRVELLTAGEAAVVTVYLDGVVLNTVRPSVASSEITISLAAYKTPAVIVSGLKFSIVPESMSMYSAYREYMETIDKRSLIAENADSLGEISNLSSLVNGCVKKDSSGIWSSVDSPLSNAAGDRCVLFNPEGKTNTRIAMHNINNAPVYEIKFDLYLPRFSGNTVINVKTDEGWIADRMTISAGGVECDGSGISVYASFISGYWHNVGILYDGVSGKLWFSIDGRAVYMNEFDDPYKYMEYIEVLGGDNVYYTDNYSFCSYYHKTINEVTASFYISQGSNSEKVCANVEFETDGNHKNITIYGVLYDVSGRTAILKSVSKNDIAFSSGEKIKSVSIEIGGKDDGEVAKLLYFDSQSHVAPVYPPDICSVEGIGGDIFYMDFEDKKAGDEVCGGTVCELGGRNVLCAVNSTVKFDALCVGDFVISYDISSESAISGEFVVYGGGTPAYLIRFESDGSIRLYDGTYLSSYGAEMKQITAVFSYEDKCFDFYADGQCVYKGFYPGVTFDKCVYFEYTFTSPNGNGKVCLDNILVYPPYVYTDKCFYYNKHSHSVDTEREIVLTSKTSIPSDTKQRSLMDKKASLHMRSGVAFDGSQKHILENLPYYKGNEIMAPEEFYEKVLGLSVVQNGDKIKIGSNISMTIGSANMTVSGLPYSVSTSPELLNSELYLPLTPIVQKGLKKSVFSDNSCTHGGMVVIADSGFSMPYGSDLQALNDFCFYYRPDRNSFYDCYNRSELTGVHPRIMATAQDFEMVREEIKTNSVKAKWYSNLIKYCDSLKDVPTLCYELRDGVRLMYVSDDFENMMIALGAAYKISGDRKYFDYAWKHIKAVAEMPDWNPSHHIDVGIMALGYAVAYDWFYDILSDSQRALMEKGAYNNCLRTLNDAVESENTPYGWVMMENNHNVFVNAGNMAVCLAFMDIYPDICSKLGADIVRILESFLDKFAPMGQYYEGPHYATIAIDYTTRLFAVMEKTIGLFRLDKAEGFNLIGDYLTYMQSDVSNFNFADGEPGFVSSSGLFWLYDHFNMKGVKDNLAKGFYSSATRDEAAQCLLWYDVSSEDESSNTVGLDVHYPEEEIITMRDSYQNGQVFVGIKAGDTVYDHSHYDVGSFVFDAFGKRWAHDLGKDDYNLYYKYPSSSVFRVRAESHNVLLLSPDSDPGFDDYKRAPVTEFVCKPDAVKAVVDMTEVYGARVVSAERGFLFTDNRKILVVRDEVEVNKTTEAYWLMYIDSDVYITDSNSVILTDRQDNSKKVKVEFCSSHAGSIVVEDAKPFPKSAVIPEQNPNIGFKRLCYKVVGSGSMTITAKITPVGFDFTDISQYDVPIGKWTI